MKKLLSQHEAENELKPFYKDLVESIDEGFTDYLRIMEFKDSLGMFTPYQKRTRAGIIHEQITGRIASKLSEVEEVKTGEWNKIFGVKINEQLFIRFKKFNEDFSTSNVSTNQNEMYLNQMNIPGFPDAPTFLYAGYIPDATWTRLNGIYIACWKGSQVQWVIDAGKYSSEQLGINFYSTDLQEVEVSPTQQRVVLKEGALKKSAANG